MRIEVFRENEACTRKGFLGTDEEPLGFRVGEELLEPLVALGRQNLDETREPQTLKVSTALDRALLLAGRMAAVCSYSQKFLERKGLSRDLRGWQIHLYLPGPCARIIASAYPTVS